MKLLFSLCFALNLDLKFYFFGRVGGWLEIWRVKLISTQVLVLVEVWVELGKIAKLIDETNSLVNKGENEEIIKRIEADIAEKEAGENRRIIVENFKPLADNPDGNNLQEMWKLHSKLYPKNSISLPVAKKNFKGKLVCSAKDIKKRSCLRIQK